MMTRCIRLIFAILLACSGSEARCQEGPRDAVEPDISNPPLWLRMHDFRTRHFTFARARNRSPDWATDYPDADLNLIAKIESLTSLSASLEVVDVGDLDPEKISMLYFSHAASLDLTEGEARSIRKYLEGGGFAMFDDSWGNEELARIERLFDVIFPHRKLQEVPLSHPIFQSVFRFAARPQVLSLRKFVGLDDPSPKANAASIDDRAMYEGVFGDQGRLMAIVCHNTDTADGWEHDGEIPLYLHEHTNQRAFPLAINIVYVALTQ